MATKITIVRESGTSRVRTYNYARISGGTSPLDPPVYAWLKVVDNANAVVVQTNNRFDGVNNPSWRSQVKNHQPAGTSASGYKATFSPTTGSAVHFNSTKTVRNEHSGWVAGERYAWTPGVTFSDAKADSAARLAFVSKYASYRQSFSTGTFLGELRETLHMIRHPAIALRKGLDVYHGAVKERLRRIKSDRPKRSIVAGTWLEYSFGWTPLVRDIQDAMKALAETFSGKLHQTVFSAKGESEEPWLRHEVVNSTVGGLNYRLYYQTKGNIVVRYKGGVVSEVSTYPTIRETWGIRFQDIVPTVYELIPYSFLLDYFSNLGDVLSAMSQGPVHLAWGNKTSRLERTTRMTSGEYYSTVNGSVSGGLAGGSSSLVSFVRTPVNLVSVGLSDLRFQVPGFGSKKWLNIGALALLRR